MGLRVAVVGAGYAGMAAAATLVSQEFAVTVFEAGAVPGGRARRVQAQGIELDNGQHILIGAYSELFRLMALVGVPDSATLRLPLELRTAGGFRLRAPRLPFGLGLLKGLLSARGLSFRERVRAVRFMGAMKSRRFSVSPDRTVDALLSEFGQTGVIARRLWHPLCISALNTLPSRASAAAFLAVVRDALCGAPSASDLVLPRVDLSRLFPEPAAQYVARNGGEVRYRTRVDSLDPLRQEFGAVIVAVGPHHAGALLPGVAPDYDYQPIYTCYLQYPEPTCLPFPMLGLEDGFVQWVFDRGQLLGEQGRLACVISAQGAHQDLSHEALAARCHEELARACPGLPAPQWSQVIAEKRATLACVPGVPRPASQTSLPGVFLAGDYTDPEYPPTLEAAVRSGVRAATLAIKAP